MNGDNNSDDDDHHPLSDRNHSRQNPPPQNSNVGCWIGGCGTAGCALLIGVPLLIVGGLAFLLFLTPIPVNLLADAVEQDNRNVKIGTVSGNILQGFTVPHMEFPDTEHPDRINKLEDIRFLYPNLLGGLWKNEIDFEEISVGRATLYITYDSDINGTSAAENKSRKGDSANAESSKTDEFELFRLRKIDIKNIELIDPEKDFHFNLDELTLDGLEITPKHFKMGQFTIRSSVLDFQMSPMEIDKGSKIQASSRLEINATLQPNEELSVIKPLSLKGNIEFLSSDNISGHLEAFDQKIHLTFTEKKKEARLKINDLTLTEYFDTEFLLPSKINWEATLQNKEKDVQIVDSTGGSFYLGEAMFNVEAGVPVASEILKAIHQDGEDMITLFLFDDSPDPQKNGSPRFKLSSSKDPTLDDKEILGGLYYGKTFEELSQEEQNRVLLTIGAPQKVE